MRHDNPLIHIIAVFTLILVLDLFIIPSFRDAQGDTVSTEVASVKKVDKTIMATGTVESENEADLHFQTGGKLAALPVKEGDSVQAGEVIARLDSYALQRQLAQSLNTYKNSQSQFNQVTEYNENNVLTGQQRVALDTSNKQAYDKKTEADIINDTVQRVIDQNKNNLNNAQINVDLASYAISLSSLTAPFDGVVTHEDVQSAGVNVTPVTTFTVVDPSAMVFRANVSQAEISYITTGARATIALSGDQASKITGTVSKIYPQKQTSASGDSTYQVDIQPDTPISNYMYKESGSVLIDNKFSTAIMLAPAWTILGNNTVWVLDGDKSIKRTVVAGDTVGSEREIKSGLSATDKIIINPKTIIKNEYPIL